ncbi:hypothetical protein [Streptomyces sp. CBMA152]|uniref:hypothetical protein n=1 Tax=Streptomyces sp. CBMA152 TaxID=1896312 RepID=UPI0016609EF8|nr:hypothetical protein [Streptomyces sp. CBMA152]MBD0743012.1 hypothetical protein [Streptomyces sp. CBMA152]
MSPSPTRRHRSRLPRLPFSGGEAGCLLDTRIERLITTREEGLRQWAAVDIELAHHGLSALHHWIIENTLPAKVRRLTGQRIHLHDRLRDDHDAIAELCGLTVACALPRFRRRALAGTGWQPGRGTSAPTYFVGRCLMIFPGEYRRWKSEEDAADQPRPLPPYATCGYGTP